MNSAGPRDQRRIEWRGYLEPTDVAALGLLQDFAEQFVSLLGFPSERVHSRRVRQCYKILSMLRCAIGC